MMKKWQVIICSMLAMVVLAACGNKVDDATAQSYISKAEEIVQFLNDGQFEKITAQFDGNMGANLSATQLAEITTILVESGSYEGIKKESVQEKDGLKIVVLVAKYSKDTRIYTVTYDADDKIAGLFVQ